VGHVRAKKLKLEFLIFYSSEEKFDYCFKVGGSCIPYTFNITSSVRVVLLIPWYWL